VVAASCRPLLVVCVLPQHSCLSPSLNFLFSLSLSLSSSSLPLPLLPLLLPATPTRRTPSSR
jgi:hypothetical protein